MKYINFKNTIITIFILCSVTYMPISNSSMLFLESGSYRYNFKINFDKERFYYAEICPINEIFNKYSQGSIRVNKDTVFLTSDYDIMNIPVNIKSNLSNNNEGNILIFNFESQILARSPNSVFFVFNHADTVLINSDTVLYQNKINCFYLFIYHMEDDYIIDYNKSLPLEMQDELIPIPKREVRLKTVIYENKGNNNLYRISISTDVDLWNYQTVKDTIIVEESRCLWNSFFIEGNNLLKYSKLDSSIFYPLQPTKE